MAISAHKTEYVVTFWVPLPFPLGVPDGAELSLPHEDLFPEEQSGFVVTEDRNGPQFVAQLWRIFQKKQVPSSPGVEFAESLMRARLEGDLGLHEYRLDTSAELKKLGIYQQTVIEVTCAIEQPEHRFIVAKLKEVAAAIADFHVRLNTLQGLPASRFDARAFDPAPFLVMSVEDSENVLYGLTSPGDVTKYAHSLNVPEATNEEIAYAAQLNKDEPFRAAKVLEMEALNAYAGGSSILAAICFGATAEARLTELCQFLSWEAEDDPRTVSKAISGRGGVADSGLQLLSKHLKGNWHRHSSPPLKAWHNDIVLLRNQTAHNGHEPTAEEIDRAQTAFYGLLDFIRERLLEQMHRYPYVANYYIGQSTLQELGLLERWEKVIEDYPITFDPTANFFRYKAEVRYRGEERKFDFSRLQGSNILQITDGTAERTWVQLDEVFLLTRRISDPKVANWNELQSIRLRNADGYYTEVLTDIDSSIADPISSWGPASDVVPSLSITRSDPYEVLEYNLRPPVLE